MGTTALLKMQDETPVRYPNGTISAKDYYLQTRQVTRHFLGYHVAKPDNLFPVFNVSRKSLADSYLPVFQAFQQDGRADGIMCAMTMIRIDNDLPFPPCASSYLNEVLLRREWQSDALVQTDCCDSVSTINEPFHYKNISSDKDALAIAVLEGNLQNYYGYKVHQMRTDLLDLAAKSPRLFTKVEQAAKRVLLSFFRLGFFDSQRKEYPFRVTDADRKVVGGWEHAEVARKVARSAIVLLRNERNALPIEDSDLPLRLAVIGPFANCTECHLHSYNGIPPYVTTILTAARAAFRSSTVEVLFAPGSNFTCASNQPMCWTDDGPAKEALVEAAAVAKRAQAVILCVGLGATMEAEGLDRTSMRLTRLQQELLLRTSETGTKVILVLVSAGGVDLNEELTSGILWAPYLGQEG